MKNKNNNKQVRTVSPIALIITILVGIAIVVICSILAVNAYRTGSDWFIGYIGLACIGAALCVFIVVQNARNAKKLKSQEEQNNIDKK